MVLVEGIEPTRPCGHRILSPARLPVPPHQLGRLLLYQTAGGYPPFSKAYTTSLEAANRAARPARQLRGPFANLTASVCQAAQMDPQRRLLPHGNRFYAAAPPCSS